MESSAPAPRRLANFEIAAHVLADGFALYVLVTDLGSMLVGFLHWSDRPSVEGLVADLPAELVLLLSAVVIVRRVRAETRGLRVLERTVSIVTSALGGLAAVVCLAFMVSGAMYKGSSPDAGGMAVMAGLLLFYPMAGLSLLPFALNASRLPSYVRWRLLLLAIGLALLPVGLLVVLAVIRQ